MEMTNICIFCKHLTWLWCHFALLHLGQHFQSDLALQWQHMQNSCLLKVDNGTELLSHMKFSFIPDSMTGHSDLFLSC